MGADEVDGGEEHPNDGGEGRVGFAVGRLWVGVVIRHGQGQPADRLEDGLEGGLEVRRRLGILP